MSGIELNTMYQETQTNYNSKPGKAARSAAGAQTTAVNGNKAWGKTDSFESRGASSASAPAAAQEQGEEFFKFTDDNGKFSFIETGKTIARTLLSPLMLFGACTSDPYTIAHDVEQSVTMQVDSTKVR